MIVPWIFFTGICAVGTYLLENRLLLQELPMVVGIAGIDILGLLGETSRTNAIEDPLGHRNQLFS